VEGAADVVVGCSGPRRAVTGNEQAPLSNQKITTN
jgi:hypothetical protein